MKNGSRLLYSILAALSVLLMSAGGVSGHLIMQRVEAVETRSGEFEKKLGAADRERDTLASDIRAICNEVCHFEEDFDSFRAEHSTKPLIRRACLCPREK